MRRGRCTESHAETGSAPCAGDSQVNDLVDERETVNHVDVVGPRTVGDDLETPAVQIEDIETALLICPEHEAKRGIAGVDPDGGVVRRIARAGYRFSLDARRGRDRRVGRAASECRSQRRECDPAARAQTHNRNSYQPINTF